MILVLVVAVKSTRTAAAETSKQIKLPSGSSIFYTIILYISDNYKSEISIEEGQYEYSLYSGDEVFDTGILQFGEFKRENTEYNIEDKQIIIYE